MGRTLVADGGKIPWQVRVNSAPVGNRTILRYADRFAFANIAAREATEALHQIVAHVHAKTNDRAKIVLTVSPVPLHGTFTNRDVVSANLYSKATLLSAAVATASEYANVDYFPSYELVTMSRPDTVWEEDGIHVKPALVKRVIDVFMENYLSKTGSLPDTSAKMNTQRVVVMTAPPLLNTQLTAENEAALLRARLGAKEKEAASQQRENERLRSQISLMLARADAVSHYHARVVAGRDARLATLENSRSWRMTKPIRDANAAVPWLRRLFAGGKDKAR